MRMYVLPPKLWTRFFFLYLVGLLPPNDLDSEAADLQARQDRSRSPQVEAGVAGDATYQWNSRASLEVHAHPSCIPNTASGTSAP